jgi:glycosyltransferase involved in cell wall biosynthesis
MASAPLGVNVFGYLYAESGVGEHTRLLVAALAAAGVPYSVVPLAGSGSRQRGELADDAPTEPVHPVHVVSLNADQIEAFYRDRGPAFFANTYTIGLWAWEVEDFPRWLAEKAEYVDEIWANSSFSARAIAARVDKPVFPFPLPVAEPAGPFASRAELGLPDDFLVLFAFDFDSVAARKNPEAAVHAFRRAFAAGEGPRLVIKTVNAERHPRDAARLRETTLGRPDIEVRDGYLSPADQRSLMNACDLYLSLHRSEGFGLTLAEAMALGKPVVATAYSGNLDFMTDDIGTLVPFRFVEIGPGCGPYPAFGRWAEADVDSAARALRAAWREPEGARAQGARARSAILRDHGVSARAEFLRQRAAAIAEILAAGWQRPPVTMTAEQYAEALLRHGPDLATVGPMARRLRAWAERFRTADRAHRHELDRALLAHSRQGAAEVARIVARQERADLDRWVAELTRRVEALEQAAAQADEAPSRS